MSESLIECAVQKSQAFEGLMSYSSEYYIELESEEIDPVEVQTIERNFLKLFGILL